MQFGRIKKNGDPLQDRIDCLVGSGTDLTGDLTFTGGLRIDGHVDGDVIVSRVNPGTLIIGDEGLIEGDVRVSHLIVFGCITGSVHATGLVDLRGSARIAGDVHYGTIEIQKGAVIEGHLIKQKSAGGFQ